jgi:hypothetical protein
LLADKLPKKAAKILGFKRKSNVFKEAVRKAGKIGSKIIKNVGDLSNSFVHKVTKN